MGIAFEAVDLLIVVFLHPFLSINERQSGYLMKKNVFILFSCLLIIVALFSFIPGCSSSSDSDSTGSVTGVCKKAAEMSKYPIMPVSGVVVTHVGSNKSTTTGDDGKFVLQDLPEGLSSLTFEKTGHTRVSVNVDVKAGTTTTVTTDSDNSVFLPPDPQTSSKKWTMFIYMAADNSLAEDSTTNINELEQLGSTKDVNIVVFLDKTGQNSRLYYITKDDDTTTISSPYYDFGSNLDSGDPAILSEVASNVLTNYPSDRFYFELWNHGSGIERDLNNAIRSRNVCEDDTSGTHLTEVQVGTVLTALTLQQGKIFDILACDACLMANLEVAYQWKDYCTYFVASENSVPAQGFPYNTMFASLIANPDIANIDFAKNMVTEFGTYYKANGEGYETLSVINMSKVSELSSLLDDYCIALKQNGDAENIWSKAYRPCDFMGQADLKDIYAFAYYEKNFCNQSSKGFADTQAQAVINAITPVGDDKVIVSSYYGYLFDGYFKTGVGGISIWGWYGGEIPVDSPYKDTLFYSNSYWPSFITWINANHTSE